MEHRITAEILYRSENIYTFRLTTYFSKEDYYIHRIVLGFLLCYFHSAIYFRNKKTLFGGKNHVGENIWKDLSLFGGGTEFLDHCNYGG